jgi:5'-3' exonuclease
MLAIIDGDVVAYHSCGSRAYDPEGRKYIGKKTFTPEEDAAYLEAAWKRCKELMIELQEICFADKFKSAVRSPINFRDTLFPDYKRHRKDKPPHQFVPTIRQRMIDNGLAVEAVGMEADDYLRIWQQECVAIGEPYIICTIDKDLKCIPGKQYLMHKKKFLVVSPEEATRFYYEQLLKGDPTDNIKAIPGCGPVMAENLLKECQTEEEFRTTVMQAYQAAFGPDEWEKELILTGHLITLRKTINDEFSLKDWPVVPYVEQEVATGN